MGLPDYERFRVNKTIVTNSPRMLDEALALPQGRICDLVPGEWAAAQQGSVNWDTDTGKWTIDTWNQCVQGKFDIFILSKMPVVMRACVTDGQGKSSTDYIADVRYVHDITNINRPMRLHDENPETNPILRDLYRSHGTVILRNLILPTPNEAVLQGNPDFYVTAFELSEEVDRLVLKSIGAAHPLNPNYVEAQEQYRRLHNPAIKGNPRK